MLAKLSHCSNARTQIFEVLAKVEQSSSNARFLKKPDVLMLVFLVNESLYASYSS